MGNKCTNEDGIIVEKGSNKFYLQIQEVNNWLARDDVLSQLSPGKVTTLYSQLAGNPVGLKGGNLFTITKSFLANVKKQYFNYSII